MPSRIRLPALQCRRIHRIRIASHVTSRQYAAVASHNLSQSSFDHVASPLSAVHRYDPAQPPSHRRPDARKTQLLRQYISLLRSCPVVLLFQHNSLLAAELTALRTVLTRAMLATDATHKTNYATHIKLQIIQTGLLDTALRLAEFWQPQERLSDAATSYTHNLSEEAFQTLTENEKRHGLEPLLTGPIAMLSFPSMSSEHLKVALSVLSPSPEFPAPKRRAMPAYHELNVQSAVAKLLLLGARIESQAMDLTRLKWVGGLAGGIDTLRAQLLAVLQGNSSQLVQTLSSASSNLSSTLKAREHMLQEGPKS